MKFPYAVKYHGRIYPPNTDIPEKVKKDEPVKETKTAKKGGAKNVQ